MESTASNNPNLPKPSLIQNEEEKRISRVVRVLCLMISLGLMLSAIHTTMDGQWRTISIMAGGEAGILLSLWLCQAGMLVWSTRLLVFTVLATATVLVCLAGDGIHDVVIMVYPSSLVVASQILTKRSFIAYSAVLILSVACVVTSEIQGYLVTRWSALTRWSDLVDISIILLVTAVAVEMLTESLRKSLFHSQRNEEALGVGNLELARQAERLRQSEESLLESRQILRSVLDTIPVRVFWKDENLNYLGCNRSFAIDAGVSSPAEIVGKNDFDLAWKKQAGEYRKADQEVIDTGVPKLQYEDLRVTADGRKLWLRISKTPLLDGGKKVRGVLGSYEEFTEYRKLEEQLRQAQKMDAFGQLAGGVAHDFNNILTVILSHASLLEMGKFQDEKYTQSIQQIVQAAERAANLTRQLLTFSRRQILQTIDLDLNEVVGNMTKMLQRLIGEHISLQSHYAAGGAPVHADPGMMEQVLMNLAVNSRDAMPRGGKLILKTEIVSVGADAASRSPGARPGKFVRLCVFDSGHGIAPENLPRIFEPFFTTKEAGRGTGLGLATVFGIVQQHQGWIELDSEVGNGTSFYIYLPCGTENHAQIQPAATVLDMPGGHETILLVEDEEQVRILARSTLQLMGYLIFEAANGMEALKIWEEHTDSIHLLLTDLIMPGEFNGRELADRLHTDKPDLKVIFCSGYSDEMLGGDFALRGDCNFLQKPYSPSKLVRLVRDALDGKASQIKAAPASRTSGSG